MISFFSDAPLGRCTTFCTGGRATRLGYAYTREELTEAADEGALILGRGSNVLVGDAGYFGTVAINRTNAFSFGCGTATCDSGVLLSRLARAYAEQGRTGLEWAYGLPGTVGGAIVGNAGAFGGCMADVVTAVWVRIGGRTERLSGEECGFSYRHSGVRGIVLGAELRAQKGDAVAIRALCEENLQARRNKQPLGASGGSVFKAADGVPAGLLIDRAGLKGLACGGAEISKKHANFIVNRGGAASGDVLQLMNAAQAVVFDRFGVRLEREIKLIGEFT